LGYKLYATHTLALADFVAVPIGLVAVYLRHMYFKKIFSPENI
jgi:hypothetical protein